MILIFDTNIYNCWLVLTNNILCSVGPWHPQDDSSDNDNDHTSLAYSRLSQPEDSFEREMLTTYIIIIIQIWSMYVELYEKKGENDKPTSNLFIENEGQHNVF